MLLNNVKRIEVCEANKVLLDEQKKTFAEIVNEEEFINLSALPSSEAQTAFFDEFCENEKLNAQHSKKIFQKEKYKAKNIIMFMIAGLTLMCTGFFIAPFIVVIPIILPIASIVLLSGVAIIALTKLFLNMRLNSLETCNLKAEAFLDKVMASKGNNENEVDSNDIVYTEIQELKKTNELTRALCSKVDMLEETTQRFFSTFSKTSHEDSDLFHESEKKLSPSHT